MAESGRGTGGPALALLLGAALLAVSAAAPARAAPPTLTAEQIDSLEREIEAGMRRLDAVETQAAQVKDEILDIQKRSVEIAAQVQAHESRVAETEARLAELTRLEAELRERVAARKEDLSRTLAGLQRLQLDQPPALIVHPDSAVEASRSALLLGYVVPVLEADARSLAASAEELAIVRTDMEEEQETLLADRAALSADRERLVALLDAKKTEERRIAAERAKLGNEVAQKSVEAEKLKLRFAEIEAEMRNRAPREKPAPASPPVAERRGTGAQLRQSEPVEPAQSYASLAARGPMVPARGDVLYAYGQPDGAGGRIKGMIMRTLNGAQIVSPAGGRLRFAGPVKGYGQMLIIQVPGGYHVILAGLDRIYGTPGQPLLAGEPVGAMGLGVDGQPGPELYVEIRKDGTPIDPMSWLGTWEGKISG